MASCVTRIDTSSREPSAETEEGQAALAKAQRMEVIGQLTGGVAHDFNNLLTAIQGSIELALRRAVRYDPETARLLVPAIKAVARGATLTHRLLAYSRRQTLSPVEIDLNQHVRTVADLLRQTLGETIRIETVLAEGLWRCLADPTEVESALLNLAVNARDAMKGGGKLIIETENVFLDAEYAATHEEVTAGPHVMVAVSDTGTGMSAHTLEHVFEPFFTTKGVSGTGLGLSQVYGFVKQSGGHVNIYSEPGQGTTVKIYLRRHIPSGIPEPEPEQLSSNGFIAEGGETVLLVEDDNEVREFSAAALDHLGYRVLEAEDATSALNLLSEHPQVALLFTDVGLPDLNGRQLAEEARRRVPELRIVYTTGYTRNAIVHHGVLDKDVELLAKPFTIEELGRKLREVLRKD